MESQSHGNQFEDLILFEITGLTKEQYQPLLKGGYTAPMDIERGIHSDHNYSIKTSKNGKTIGCGDILRFRTHCSSTEFKLLVGAWRQSSVSTKTYTGIYEFNISPSVENLLWGNLTTEAMMPFVSYVKAIPPGKQAQTVHKQEWKSRRDQLLDKYNSGIININAKIDSGNQRRIQCSLKTDDLIRVGVPYQLHTSSFYGLPLPLLQQSEPRKFNKILLEQVE
jgi:hypothetical protein